MLNLLPKIQKNRLMREYRIRFWVIAFTLILAGEMIALILLLPPYIIAKTRLDILNSESASLKVQNLNAETAALSDIVKRTNNYLSIFISTSTPKGIVQSFQNIVDVRDKGIKINSFFYRAGNGQQQIIISGNAVSRQVLLDFNKKLKNLPGAISVELPVSDFAKAKDIDFSMNILIRPQLTS